MKKKIAIFHNLSGGGSVRVINEISRYLSKESNVTMFTISEYRNGIWKEKLLDFKENNISVKIPQNFFLKNLWILFFLPQIHEKLAKKIDSENYDVVIVTHDYLTKSPYILKFLRTKTIYIIHEPPREFYEPQSIHAPFLKNKMANIFRCYIKKIDKENVSKADILIVNSEYSKKVIKKIYDKNSEILYPGIDTKKFHPNDKIKKEDVILMVGGLARFKGHYFVSRSLVSILNKYKLVIIGDGKKIEKEYIRIQVPDHLQKNIIFLNHISDSKLVQYYQKAKVLCIGAHLEPFGMTSIEAQACGTPVVAVNEGGLKETIIDKRTGYLSKRSKNEFKEKTLIAIKNSKRLKNYCIDQSKKWKWENHLKRLDSIIKSLK